MNSPNPVPQPVLPAAPWYSSPVQVQLVTAGVAQAISIVFRTVDALGYEIKLGAADVDALAANVTQGVAMACVAWAWWKRQRSQVAPLTFTAKAAEDLTKARPPILEQDPTKLPKV